MHYVLTAAGLPDISSRSYYILIP